MASFVRKAFSPPPYSEALTPAQWRDTTKMRRALVALSILVDLALMATLRGDDRIDQRVLAQFGVINIAVLTLDLVITEAQLRSRRLQRLGVVAMCVVLEAFTIMVWVQASGSLTSYFLAAGPSFVFLYRWLYGYAIAVVMALAMSAFHTTAFALEKLDVLAPERLFVAPVGPEYSIPNYQLVLMGSFYGVVWFGFAAGNVIVDRLRERDRALAEVRATAARVAKQTAHGRLSGKLLDDEYALGELLGRGGMGEVYAARGVSDDQPYAVKVLHAHLVTNPTARERFRREAVAANRVPFAHRATIARVGRDSALDVDYIAMEYLRGEDLSAHLRRHGSMDVAAAIAISRRIAVALDAAHEVGVVHRDLKPQNIFLASTGTDGGQPDVRLLDFGMSKVLDSEDQTLTRGDALIGTVAYMAPEQATGLHDDVGPAADRYALASIAYRMLTGQLPFDEPDLVRALNAVAHALPPAPTSVRPELPSDLDFVLAIGLAKSPADRYPSAAAFADDLELAQLGRLPEATRARAKALGNRAGAASSVSSATLTAVD